MGSKLNPGKFDCYANALPDEPMFVLLARDPFAPELVRMWARTAELSNRRSSERMGFSGPVETVGPEKIAEAMDCAEQMKRWREANPKPVGGYPRAADHGWVCYNAGPDEWFWLASRAECEHELTDFDTIRPATALEKDMLQDGPTAYVKRMDRGTENECVVVCARGDVGSFPVYG